MVVSSLNSPFDRECLWHIQGFLGGQHEASDNWMKELRAQERDKQFEQELVIGHGDYRRATTTAVHFRRCFGEVFRSRSFLFLGSSMAEQYFLNLFGEILDLVGPSPVPHFAFVLEDTVDHRFLSDQMNTTVVQYKKHSEVSEYLRLLKKEVDRPRTVHWCNVVSNPDDLQISALSAPPLADLARATHWRWFHGTMPAGGPVFRTRSMGTRSRRSTRHSGEWRSSRTNMSCARRAETRMR